GDVSALPDQRRIGPDCEVYFLPRHGRPHHIPPHEVNYRANIWLLGELGVDAIVASFAVGGIDPALALADIVVAHQIIDYTWGRAHTFYDRQHERNELRHVDFTHPFDARLNRQLVSIGAGTSLAGTLHANGVYGCTQGPRLESAAEIDRMERDGCTIVGMTAMPEAGLAREAGIPYASLSLIVNPAAGRSDAPIDSASIRAAIDTGMGDVTKILAALFECGDEFR
ncbi:MAG: S-methyl-5'-thioinosine phosphorylase, partial [Gammaproteobacteria bacterium]|nr:S-methyl-5'-thioinosine phosphorylase [Gammaproteobacteria bacterium]